MSKQREPRKEGKKSPAMTIKEKRAAKKAKKQEKDTHKVVPGS